MARNRVLGWFIKKQNKKKPSLSNRLAKPLWAIYLNKQTKKYMILKVHVAIHVLCTWDEIYIYIYIYIYVIHWSFCAAPLQVEHLFTSSVIEYANTARASLPGAERVRLHVSAFNSAPDCKWLLSAIGLFGATWSRTHLVYRWNIPTIQTVWGEPKLNHSLYRQLQPGRRWKWVCEFVYRMLLSLLQIPI